MTFTEQHLSQTRRSQLFYPILFFFTDKKRITDMNVFEIFTLGLFATTAYLLIAKISGLSPFAQKKQPKDELTHQTILDLFVELDSPEMDGTCYGFTLNWAVAVALGEEAFFYRQVKALKSHQNDLSQAITNTRQKNLAGEPLSFEETVLGTLPLLIKRICVAQDPDRYRGLHGKLLWQSDINPILKTIIPTAQHIRQIYCKTHTFASIKETVGYLDWLMQIGLDEQIAVLISTPNHSMGFRRQGKVWHFININDLYKQSKDRPYLELTSPELAAELYREYDTCLLTRRLTLNTDFIGIDSTNQQKKLSTLDNKYPEFSEENPGTTSDKLSFFALAASQGDIISVKKCLQADWSLFSKHYMHMNSAIATAIQYGRQEVVREMIPKIKLRINEKNQPNSSTLLHLACATGHGGIVKDLLEIEGIDINAQDKYGLTPLMYACSSDQTEEETELFQALFDQGASAIIKDNQNLTALDHAFRNNHDLAIGQLERFKECDSRGTVRFYN